MELFQIDDAGHLFISPAIDSWSALKHHRIDTVIDLDGGLDPGVPENPNEWLYIYFPIYDEGLPNVSKLEAIARLGAALVQTRHRVLSHCGLGFNRSALIAGLILCELGFTGPDAISRLRARRPGALFNERFEAYLRGRG
jgi:protein-tyrosine phosphatase